MPSNASALSSILVKITADASEFIDALNAASASAKGFAAVGASLVATGGAIVGAMVLMTEQAGKFGREIEYMSERFDMSTQSLAGIKYGAEQLGVPMDMITMAMRKLATEAVNAANGNSAAADAFRTIGVSATDATGNVKPMSDLFTEVSSALKNVTNSTQLAADATLFFGRGGLTLLPILKSGSDGLKEWSATAEALGVSVTKSQAEMAKAFMISQTNVEAAVRGVAFAVGDALMPVLTGLANEIVATLIPIRQFISAHQDATVAIAATGAALIGSGGLLIGLAAMLAVVPLVTAGWNQVSAALASATVAETAVAASSAETVAAMLATARAQLTAMTTAEDAAAASALMAEAAANAAAASTLMAEAETAVTMAAAREEIALSFLISAETELAAATAGRATATEVVLAATARQDAALLSMAEAEVAVAVAAANADAALLTMAAAEEAVAATAAEVAFVGPIMAGTGVATTSAAAGFSIMAYGAEAVAAAGALVAPALAPIGIAVGVLAAAWAAWDIARDVIRIGELKSAVADLLAPTRDLYNQLTELAGHAFNVVVTMNGGNANMFHELATDFEAFAAIKIREKIDEANAALAGLAAGAQIANNAMGAADASLNKFIDDQVRGLNDETLWEHSLEANAHAFDDYGQSVRLMIVQQRDAEFVSNKLKDASDGIVAAFEGQKIAQQALGDAAQKLVDKYGLEAVAMSDLASKIGDYVDKLDSIGAAVKPVLRLIADFDNELANQRMLHAELYQSNTELGNSLDAIGSKYSTATAPLFSYAVALSNVFNNTNKLNEGFQGLSSVTIKEATDLANLYDLMNSAEKVKGGSFGQETPGALEQAIISTNALGNVMMTVNGHIVENEAAWLKLRAVIGQPLADDSRHALPIFDETTKALMAMKEHLADVKKAEEEIKSASGHVFDAMLAHSASVFDSVGALLKAWAHTEGRIVFEDFSSALFSPLQTAFDEFFKSTLKKPIRDFGQSLSDTVTGAVRGAFGAGGGTNVGNATASYATSEFTGPINQSEFVGPIQQMSGAAHNAGGLLGTALGVGMIAAFAPLVIEGVTALWNWIKGGPDADQSWAQAEQAAMKVAAGAGFAQGLAISPGGNYLVGTAGIAGPQGMLKGYAMGTSYVPETGPALLHQGERVLSPGDNMAFTASLGRGNFVDTSKLEALVQKLIDAVESGGEAAVYMDGQKVGKITARSAALELYRLTKTQNMQIIGAL